MTDSIQEVLFEDPKNTKKQNLTNETLIRSELNLERWPSIWQLSKGTPVLDDRTLVKQISVPNGSQLVARVELSADKVLGNLTTEDQKTLYGLIYLWESQGKPRVLTFAIRQLLKVLGKPYGSNSRKAIRESLARLKKVNITWENSFYDKNQRNTLSKISLFNILSTLEFISRGEGKNVRETVRVVFDERIEMNLRLNYSLPTRAKVLLGFRSGISQLVYKLIEPKLFRIDQYERRTKELFEEMGVLSERYQKLSLRVTALKNVISELEGLPIQDGVLSVQLVEADEVDYKLIARKKRLQAQPGTSEVTINLDDLELFGGQAGLLVGNADLDVPEFTAERHLTLAEPERFVKHFLKTFDLKRKPTAKEISLASGWISKYNLSVDDGKRVVEFAQNAAQKTGFEVQNLAGIGQYIELAITTGGKSGKPTSSGKSSLLPFDEPAPPPAPVTVPTKEETAKETAYQVLERLPAEDQEQWCRRAREVLEKSDKRTLLRQIDKYDPTTRRETLLSNAAKFFADEILAQSGKRSRSRNDR